MRAIIIAQKKCIGWFIGLASDIHLSLFGSEVTFFCITALAGSNQVGPCMGASARTWYYMIQCQISACATVLTFEIIAFKNILACEANSFVGSMNIAIQPNNRRHGKGLRNRVYPIPISRTHQFTFVQVHQYKSPLHRTNHERTVVLIEYQNPIIHAVKDNPKVWVYQGSEETFLSGIKAGQITSD